MLRVAVCDDNQLQLGYIAGLCGRMLGDEPHQVRAFGSPNQLISAMEDEPEGFQIALLDVRMPGMSGIELAKRMNCLSPQCQIIFISGYREYAIDAYEARHVYYVVKPELEERLRAALDAALRELEISHRRYLVAAREGGQHVLLQSGILYLERDLRVTRVVSQLGVYMRREGLDALADALDLRFMLRCHNSYVVNLLHVKAFEKRAFLMKNGENIPVSRIHLEDAKKHFTEFFTACL